MCLNDFNGKKSKIVLTLKGIDEIKSGLCKADVFYNLLNCLDVEIAEGDKVDIAKKYQLVHQGVSYVKYQDVLKALHYDNHTERWTLAGDDQLALSRNRGQSVGNLHKGKSSNLMTSRGRLK